ncbi:MAG: glycosyltransferase [Promethearchaeota archaeon]|nr:MAG: glycosyltransferase [Candidatus Lokiarchaeota archaeon]
MRRYPNLKTIAFIGNYLPRRCGIATFTSDLLQAVAKEGDKIDCWAIAMNDIPEGYAYPKQVRFELNVNSIADYQLAAEFLNVNKVDVVSLQHEYGIYGGDYGNLILSLIRNLRMPVITTLHSILPNPNTTQEKIIKSIAEISNKIVVMSQKAVSFLKDIYKVPIEKIALIHHGIPDLPFIDPNFFKDQFGVEGKKVFLTFGLINPGKGIEIMIDALPAIIRKHPDVVYIILGATHPNIKKENGEAYRHSLQRRARDLDVENNLIFHNRFVDLNELCEFLGVADIYITPYLNKEQITSGTLAYALGAGKAIISTPYWYAEEILAEGRGIIVPFNDSNSIAEKIINLLDNEAEGHNMRKQAYLFSRKMIWKEVARNYLEIFDELVQKRSCYPESLSRRKSLRTTPFEMPDPKFDHLYRLTDDVGILQHANYIIPNRNHGYCTDDNARAIITVLLAQNLSLEDKFLNKYGYRYLSFILHAFNEDNNRFRNFMSYDRKWIEEMGSEDSHGRAIWSLGFTIGVSDVKEYENVALEIFDKAVESLSKFNSPRALAFGLIGIHAYLSRFSGDRRIKLYRKEIAHKLFEMYCQNAQDDWPWIENIVAYDNGKIPQALLMSGQWLQRQDMVEAGLQSLDWLLRIQTSEKGHLTPIGNNGWYPKGGEIARFDQQPLEVQSILEACIEAFKVTQDKKWILEAQRCLEWYLGRNDLNISIYDYKTGGCSDGLSAKGKARNQGAESTLAWLLSLLNMYYLDTLLEVDIITKESE